MGNEVKNRGSRKSIKLTSKELKAMTEFGTEYDTQEVRAEKLGITRAQYLWALKYKRSRGDTVLKIRTALATDNPKPERVCKT